MILFNNSTMAKIKKFLQENLIAVIFISVFSVLLFTFLILFLLKDHNQKMIFNYEVWGR